MLRIARRAGMLVLLFSSTPLAAQRSARRVLGTAEIAAAGWHRLGEIAAALPPGASASVDGFNSELSGSRLGFFETTGNTASWIVRLDGQVMPMRVGGLWILDAIPVAITQLDSVVIVEGPTISEGRTAFLGTIDLYTRRPVRGLSAIGDYQHGDESGDPGPYRYTPRATPNIEKLGPYTSGAAAFATDRASLDVAARYASLNITDPRLEAQTRPLFPSLQTDVNASGGSGAMSVDALGGTHYLIGGRGRFTGLMHVPRLGTFQQARVVATQGGVAGTSVLAGHQWAYSATATQLDVQQLNAAPFVIGQTRTLGDGFLETSITKSVRAGAGLSLGRQETDSAHQRETERAWSTYDLDGTHAEVAVQRFRGQFKVSGSARHERPLGDSDIVAVSVTALNSWQNADNAWMESAQRDDLASMSALDVRAELTTSAMYSLRPTWYARGFSYAHTGSANRIEGIGVGLLAETPRGRRVTARLRAEAAQLLGDASAGETSTPGGFAEGTVAAQTIAGFSLALAGRYAPATLWSGPSFAMPEDTPVTQRIDLSVNKSAWHDRIRAQLVMRNLLDAEERTHPDGAQWNLRTHLAVTVALPTGASQR